MAYRDDPKLSPLVRVLPWTHNLIVLGQSKGPEEREFYLRMAVQEHWSKRELERQFRLAAFERAVLHPPKLSSLLRELPCSWQLHILAIEKEAEGFPDRRLKADAGR